MKIKPFLFHTSTATVGVTRSETLYYDFKEKLNDQPLASTYYKASDHAPVMTWAYYK